MFMLRCALPLAALLFFNLIFSAPALLGQNASPLSSISKIPDAVYKRATQAVVKITAGDSRAAGAGLVIGKTRNGLPVILTSNALIADNEDKISVQVAEQGKSAPGRLIQEKWRNRDLALIAARQPLPVAAALAYGHSDQLAAGEEVAVLGFPQSGFLGQNSGQVVRNDGTQLMVNFVLSQGQTGGPVLDKSGRVIGLVISRPQELGQAVPIDLARLVLDQWLGKAQLREPWQEESASHKWQGWAVAVGLLIATGVAVAASGVF